ncbi:hypothetical protein [Sneathiella chinensis]|uniref:Uncharacterized protein n=1 Tax=Sneathiella chinensis TaxID=349750 RepID=A0ABQ5U756_9PROT|nr:hypothetical protein [Sneathiella chinensis]GLQ06281.1 hypothetical protein GCM10007924_15020 [Sneathiella chinensis]
METTGIPPGEGKLGRKYIKSFASGIVSQFVCSAEHYAWLAYDYRVSVVTIDLISLAIDPVEFDIDRNRNLARMCQTTLFQNVRLLTPPGAVTSAVLVARFGIGQQLGDERGPSVFSVILTDDRGKEWRVDRVVERMLMQP